MGSIDSRLRRIGRFARRRHPTRWPDRASRDQSRQLVRARPAPPPQPGSAGRASAGCWRHGASPCARSASVRRRWPGCSGRRRRASALRALASLSAARLGDLRPARWPVPDAARSTIDSRRTRALDPFERPGLRARRNAGRSRPTDRRRPTRPRMSSGSRRVGDPAGDVDARARPPSRRRIRLRRHARPAARSRPLPSAASRSAIAPRTALPARRCAARCVSPSKPQRLSAGRSGDRLPPASRNRAARSRHSRSPSRPPAAPARRCAPPAARRACAGLPAAAARRSETPRRCRRSGRRRRSTPDDRVRESRPAARRGYARRGNGWPAGRPWRRPCGRSPASARGCCSSTPRTSIAPFMRASATAADGLADMRSKRAHHCAEMRVVDQPRREVFQRRAGAPMLLGVVDETRQRFAAPSPRSGNAHSRHRAPASASAPDRSRRTGSTSARPRMRRTMPRGRCRPRPSPRARRPCGSRGRAARSASTRSLRPVPRLSNWISRENAAKRLSSRA